MLSPTVAYYVSKTLASTVLIANNAYPGGITWIDGLAIEVTEPNVWRAIQNDALWSEASDDDQVCVPGRI